MIARGRIRRANALRLELEPGTAIDADGLPTTDPAAALAGCVLPMGGAKGSGLAMAINLMVGILAQSDFDDEMGSMYVSFDRPHNIGHMFWAVDPSRFGDPETTRRRTAAMIERLHGLAPAGDAESVLYPGQRQLEVRRQRLREGIPVAWPELCRLREEAEARGLTDIAARIGQHTPPDGLR